MGWKGTSVARIHFLVFVLIDIVLDEICIFVPDISSMYVRVLCSVALDKI